MEIFQSIVAAKLVFILGIINFVTVSLIFLSCRCTGNTRLINKLMKFRL